MKRHRLPIHFTFFHVFVTEGAYRADTSNTPQGSDDRRQSTQRHRKPAARVARCRRRLRRGPPGAAGCEPERETGRVSCLARALGRREVDAAARRQWPGEEQRGHRAIRGNRGQRARGPAPSANPGGHGLSAAPAHRPPHRPRQCPHRTPRTARRLARTSADGSRGPSHRASGARERRPARVGATSSLAVSSSGWV